MFRLAPLYFYPASNVQKAVVNAKLLVIRAVLAVALIDSAPKYPAPPPALHQLCNGGGMFFRMD